RARAGGSGAPAQEFGDVGGNAGTWGQRRVGHRLGERHGGGHDPGPGAWPQVGRFVGGRAGADLDRRLGERYREGGGGGHFLPVRRPDGGPAAGNQLLGDGPERRKTLVVAGDQPAGAEDDRAPV